MVNLFQWDNVKINYKIKRGATNAIKFTRLMVAR